MYYYLRRPTTMTDKAVNGRTQSTTWLAAVAGDAHFWVPTLVLIGGLLLLRWVS